MMGAGIAQVSAAAGYRTIVREVNQAALDKGLGRMRKFLDGGVEKGKMTAEARDKTDGWWLCRTELEHYRAYTAESGLKRKAVP